MDEWSMGSYVSYSDYEKLMAENERIRKLFADTERLMLLDGEYEAVEAGTYNILNDELQKLRHENTTMRVERMQDETGKRITYADYAKLKANAEWLSIEVQRLTAALRNCDRILKPLRDKAQKENEGR